MQDFPKFAEIWQDVSGGVVEVIKGGDRFRLTALRAEDGHWVAHCDRRDRLDPDDSLSEEHWVTVGAFPWTDRDDHTAVLLQGMSFLHGEDWARQDEGVAEE